MILVYASVIVKCDIPRLQLSSPNKATFARVRFSPTPHAVIESSATSV